MIHLKYDTIELVGLKCKLWPSVHFCWSIMLSLYQSQRQHLHLWFPDATTFLKLCQYVVCSSYTHALFNFLFWYENDLFTLELLVLYLLMYVTQFFMCNMVYITQCFMCNRVEIVFIKLHAWIELDGELSVYKILNLFLF